MKIIEKIKDQLFLISVLERTLDNIQERSKIVFMCAEKEAPHYTQFCEYLHCTEKQARLFAKLPAVRLADTAEELAARKAKLMNQLQKACNKETLFV